MKLEYYINVSKTTFDDLKKIGNANDLYCFGNENDYIDDLLVQCDLINDEWFIEIDDLIDFFKFTWEQTSY